MTEKLEKRIMEGLLLAVAVGLTLVHIGYVFYFPHIMHDVALYISMGQRVALGAIPYVDVVDTNPPVILYISTIPALISKFFGAPLAMTALAFFVALVLALGLGFLYALKAANPQTSRPALAMAWIFWVWAAQWVYQLGLYGQREHFIFLLMAGLVVIRQGRYAGVDIHPAQAIPFGVLATLGIGMKPHYLLPWLGIELFLAGTYWRGTTKNIGSTLIKNLLAPEAIALAVSGMFYLGHFFLVPGMSSYYTYWVPLFARGYKVFDTGWRDLLYPHLFTPLLGFWPVLLLALGAILWLKWEKRFALPALPLAFVVVSVLTLAVYILQKKGWFYQSVGFHLGLITAIGLVLGDFLQKTASQWMKILVTTGLLASLVLSNHPAATAATGKFITARETWLQTPTDPYTTLIDHLTQPSDSVMFLTTNVGNVFPAITYTGRLNANRFGMAVPLAIILSNTSKSGVSPEWQADEKIYYNGVVADIEKFSPRLVLVSSLKETTEKITVGRYLQSHSFFETTLRDYTCVGKIDNHFFVYIRLAPQDPYYVDGVWALYETQLVRPFPPDCALK